MLSVIMQNVIMLSVIKLNVIIMLSVVVPHKKFVNLKRQMVSNK